MISRLSYRRGPLNTPPAPCSANGTPGGAFGCGKGFTLLELLLVLVIMALSIALVSPAISRSLSGAHLKITARKIASTLNFARETSVRERRDCYAEVLKDRVVVSTGRGFKKEIPLPAEIKVDPAQGAPLVAFYPGGGSSGASIRISSGGKRGYRIDVEPSTGRVNVIETQAQ